MFLQETIELEQLTLMVEMAHQKFKDPDREERFRWVSDLLQKTETNMKNYEMEACAYSRNFGLPIRCTIFLLFSTLLTSYMALACLHD